MACRCACDLGVMVGFFLLLSLFFNYFYYLFRFSNFVILSIRRHFEYIPCVRNFSDSVMNHSETLQASSLWHVNVLVTLRVGGGGGEE